jgi:hypothetical protein
MDDSGVIKKYEHRELVEKYILGVKFPDGFQKKSTR